MTMGRPSPLSTEQQQSAVLYFTEGHSLQQTADYFATSKRYISMLIARAGIRRNRHEGIELREQIHAATMLSARRKGAENQPIEAQSMAGIIGAHVRWHSEQTNPKCALCAGTSIEDLKESFGF